MKCATGLILILACFKVSAIDLNNVNEFIDTSYVPVNDCPQPEVRQTIEAYLALPDLTPEQVFELKTRQTHAMICARDYMQAQSMLQVILADERADRSERYYLSAIYQYGFIYDVLSNDERCNYYLLAKDSAAENFLDIKTSASLNYASNCIEDNNEQLTSLYALLEDITRSGDKAALAHAHNSIGLFFGSKGHFQVAADQYLKANEIAREIYTNENRLTILTSAITALTLSNDLVRTKEVLDEFIEINKSVNTVQTNFLQYYSEARYYNSVQNYEKLAEAIAKWDSIKAHYDESNTLGLFKWYTAELCLVNQDRACLLNFLEEEKDASAAYLGVTSRSQSYLKFKVRLHNFLGNTNATVAAFEKYVAKIDQKITTLNDINAVHDVAEFQQKIVNLETLLEAQQKVKVIFLGAALIVLLIVLGLMFWVFRSKIIKTQSHDAVTGLLSNAAVVTQLTKLPSPGHKRTNALAIFDIANFTEVNLTVGATKGDFVLKQIANTFVKITRNSDLLGVFGPGRFILCLADIEEDAAQAFFERVKEALTHTFANEYGKGPISVDSSMSIYYGTESFNDIDEILDNMLLSLSMKSK